MKIIITRHRHTRYGMDGTLSINGMRICNTCEHPDSFLPSGKYKILITRNNQLRRKVPTILPPTTKVVPPSRKLRKAPIIRIGNGPFSLLNGSIIIGKTYLAGVLVESATHFDRLIDRLDKAQRRGEAITLTIKHQQNKI